MSVRFALGTYQPQNKVLVEGVTRTSQRGLSKEVIQHEVKISNKTEITKVKETVKVAELKNCAPLEGCPLIVV